MDIKHIALMAALAVVGMASAQDQVSMGGRPLRMTQIPPQKMGLNHVDSKAMKDMAISNMFEVRLGQLAMNHGSGAWAREYGHEMVMEHTNAQMELKTLAMHKGIRLPQYLPADKMAMVRRLSGMYGSRFDSAFRQMQLKGHRDAELKLRTAMRWGHDADVRGLEVKMLPQVVMHKRLAILRQTMMGATKQRGNHA